MWPYLQLYWRMARPSQLLAIILVYSWGVLLALGQSSSLDWQLYVSALLPALLISISIHYANEYADVETDRLTSRTLFSGGSGALPELGLAPSLALKATWVALILGISLVLIFYIFGWLPWLVLPILLLAALFGWAYSLPPLKLAWRGWGELDNALLGGLLLPLYGYAVFAGSIDLQVAFTFMPFTLLTFNNLLATTWADKAADEAVGKFTLATRLSSRSLQILYFLILLAAYLLVLAQSSHSQAIVAAIMLSALPLSLLGLWRYTRKYDPWPSVFAMVAYLIVQLYFLLSQIWA